MRTQEPMKDPSRFLANDLETHAGLAEPGVFCRFGLLAPAHASARLDRTDLARDRDAQQHGRSDRQRVGEVNACAARG